MSHVAAQLAAASASEPRSEWEASDDEAAGMPEAAERVRRHAARMCGVRR
jgi:hypothetical protein